MIFKRDIAIVPIRRSFERPIAWACACFGLALMIWGLTGCARPNTARALDVANKALVGVHVSTDALVAATTAARKDRIAHCRALALPTEAERTACLGRLGEPLAPLAAELAAAYDAAVLALEQLRTAAAAVEALAGGAPP